MTITHSYSPRKRSFLSGDELVLHTLCDSLKAKEGPSFLQVSVDGWVYDRVLAAVV